MSRIIIAGLLILGGVINASAEDDIFRDARMPHGHARSETAKMADTRACGARNGEVSNVKFPALVKCMSSRGWRIARIVRDPTAVAQRPDTGPNAPASTGGGYTSDEEAADEAARQDAAALAASQAATQITDDGIAQTVQGINGQ